MQVPLIYLFLCASSLPLGGPQDAALSPAQAPLQAPLQAPDLSVSLGGESVGTWRLEGRIPFFSPLLGPNGIAITRPVPAPKIDGKPADHPHHVSFWTAHGDVNGIDFWHDPQARIEAQSSSRVVGEDGSVELRAALVWRGPDGSAVVFEDRTLRFHGSADERVIDRTHIFRAPEEAAAVFGDTKEGTFALRLRSELCPDRGATVRNDSGQEGGKVWGQRARWVAYEAEVEGKLVGVAGLAHPDNPGGAPRWHARTYGLFAANPFGERGFVGKDAPAGGRTLEKGTTATYRWRTVLYAGQRSAEQLDGMFTRWTEPR